MKNKVITVTGSTGGIGSELVRLLSKAGVPVRAVMRDFSRIEDLPNVTWVKADLEDESLLDAVLSGTQRLFILTGNQPGFSKTQINLIRAAEQLGVEHVVKLSALGASPRTKSPLAMEHYEAEQVLVNSGMSYTNLRPHAFMQNWLDEVAQTVRAEGKIYAAIGDGRVPFIDSRDIAAVATESLLHPEKHSGKTYVLTGGEAVGYAALAEALSDATGKTVVYDALSMEAMRERMQKQGISDKMIDSFLALAAYQKAGGPTERTSDDVANVLGRAPRTVIDFANAYKEHFM